MPNVTRCVPWPGPRLWLCPTVLALLAAPLAYGETDPPPRPSAAQPNKRASRAPSDDEAARKERRAQRLEEMQRRAKGTKVRLLDGAREVSAEFLPEPAMRYDWQLGGVPDATVWLWCHRDRPVAVEKVELYRRGGGLSCLYNFFSLSPDRIAASWSDGPAWSSRIPGVQMQPLTNGPVPSEKKAVRLSQMKQIHRGFSIYQVSFRGRTEHRHLPRPLYRYGDDGSEIQDGAIFASAAHGTNPCVVCLVELRRTDEAGPQWYYGFQHLGNADAHATLDGKEVWKVTGRGWGPAPAGGDDWRMFWGADPVRATLVEDSGAPPKP